MIDTQTACFSLCFIKSMQDGRTTEKAEKLLNKYLDILTLKSFQQHKFNYKKKIKNFTNIIVQLINHLII